MLNTFPTPATPSPTPPSTTSPTTQAPPPAPPTPVITEQMVTLYRSTGTVDQISLEDYVVGVVSSEMPASFNTEALKAQSVLART
jgi:stage II sporulation protein D